MYCQNGMLHACWHAKLLLTDCLPRLAFGLSLPLGVQTRRLSKFPELMREKCDAFQLQPPRHAIPRQCTRQKIPDLDMPAEVGGRDDGVWDGGPMGGDGLPTPCFLLADCLAALASQFASPARNANIAALPSP